MYTVYLIQNKINGKKYVGCTKHSVSTRFKTHCQSAIYYNGGCLLHQDMIKYGFENFTYKALIKNIPEDKKQFYEILWIKKLNTYYKYGGYNCTYGGDGTKGYIHTSKNCHIISNAGKQSYQNRLLYNPDKEYERRNKIRQSYLGVPKSYMHKKHLSEQRLLHSSKYSKENNGFYGKHHSDDTKQLIGKANSKQVKMYDKHYNLLKVFSSGVEASKWLIDNNYCNTLQINSSISQSIKNKFKRTTCGFYWSR